MTRTITTLVVLAVLLAASFLPVTPALAQEKAPEKAQKNAVYRVDFAVREKENGSTLNTRNYVMLKLRDFGAALSFGLALVLGAALGLVAGGVVRQLFDLLDVPYESTTIDVLSRLASVLVAIVLNAAALTGLIRFLTGTSLPWRKIIPGSFFGGIALSLLQLGAGFLAVYSPTNPLLATFSVLIGFLLWLRLAGIVILVAASWVAVAARDRDVAILPQTEAERIAAEHAALLLAARVRLRTAKDARAQASWFRRPFADRAVREAEEELRQVEASAPPPPPHASRALTSPPPKAPRKPSKRSPKASDAAKGEKPGPP